MELKKIIHKLCSIINQKGYRLMRFDGKLKKTKLGRQELFLKTSY